VPHAGSWAASAPEAAEAPEPEPAAEDWCVQSPGARRGPVDAGRRSQAKVAAAGVGIRRAGKGHALLPLLYMREVRIRHTQLLAASMGVFRRDRKGLVLRPLLCMREVRIRHTQLLAASMGVFRRDRKGLVCLPLLYMRELRNHHSHLSTASVGVLCRQPGNVVR
jgi:hypothetical protein